VRRIPLICIGLAVATLATFAPALRNDFVNYDDPEYVTDNAIVKSGLSIDGARWAFVDSFGYASNWHPLTWLSHMLDWELFGGRATMHHLISVLIHTASVLILFLALQRMTGCDWKSAFVAGVFALHPLHVQSVAWIAERKDVLAALFWALAMWTYARYAARASLFRYLLVALSLLLGLLCKPMLVTLPFVLLLLDFWPLNRLRMSREGEAPAEPFAGAPARQEFRPPSVVVLEKIPLLALCAFAASMTFLAQRNAGAVLSESSLSLADRAENAVVSYVRYIGKSFWPTNLAVFYPYQQWSAAQIGASVATLIAVTTIAVALMRRAPYMIVGWLWFLGTLVPVIGIVQVGRQSMADRYMHIPMIGLAIIVAWGAADLLRAAGMTKRAIISLGAFALVACAIRTVVEIGYWHDSETLFNRALVVTGDDNPLAHNNLGTALAMRGDFAGAATHFQQAIRLAPGDAGAQRNLARSLAEVGDIDGAISHLSESIRLKETAFDQNLLGRMLLSRGRREEAIAHLARAAQLEPTNARFVADFAKARDGG